MKQYEVTIKIFAIRAGENLDFEQLVELINSNDDCEHVVFDSNSEIINIRFAKTMSGEQVKEVKK